MNIAIAQTKYRTGDFEFNFKSIDFEMNLLLLLKVKTPGSNFASHKI